MFIGKWNHQYDLNHLIFFARKSINWRRPLLHWVVVKLYIQSTYHRIISTARCYLAVSRCDETRTIHTIEVVRLWPVAVSWQLHWIATPTNCLTPFTCGTTSSICYCVIFAIRFLYRYASHIVQDAKHVHAQHTHLQRPTFYIMQSLLASYNVRYRYR